MTQPSRTPIWKSIVATLEGDITAGHYQAGDKLPTEQELATRFDVNRHTVRRALGDMSERGILRSRRGSGVFVEAEPTEYPIGKRVRFHQNIQASGRMAQRKILRMETRQADQVEATALGLKPGDPVLVYEGLSSAGNAAVAQFLSVFPERRFPSLENTLRQVTSITEALRRNGVEDYVRRETRVTAVRANATRALQLGLREGDPLLKTVALNCDLDGTPIEHGVTWFAGDRVTLLVENEDL